MAVERYDVLVVGAGLAGLAAAAALKGGPLRAALLEGQGVGSNAATPLTFGDTIAEFGLERAVRTRYNRFTFLSPDGARSSHLFEDVPLLALDYRQACLELLQKGPPDGMEVIPERAVSLERAGEGWRVGLAGGGRLLTRLLVDASGRAFFSARCLGLPVPRMASHSLGVRLAGCQVPAGAGAFFVSPSQAFGGGGGWFYPLEDGRASLGVAVLRPGGQPFAAEQLGALLRQARQTLQPFAGWTAGATVEVNEWGIIPLHPLRRFTYDRLLLVGDCAGQATNWACMGSAMALHSGRMAGEAAAQALQAGDTSAAGLRSYERLWRSRYGRIFSQAEQLAPLVYAQQDAQWGRSLALMQRLTPSQMLARLRTNWPQLPFWQLAFLVWYDRAGRARRRLGAALRRPGKTP